MKTFFLIAGTLFFSTLSAQPPQVPLYSISNIPLPTELDKQVCISGMKYFNKSLYFASERCPVIFAVNPVDGTIVNTINIQVPQAFEMEGMTSYKDKLYLVSENIAAVYEVNPQTSELRIVQTSEALPQKSPEGDGMEGIAANEKNNKFYLLRERTDDMLKSQIYTYSIHQSGDKGPVTLKYESMIELPLENRQWRYSDICMDTENSRLICLKSYSKGKLRQQFLESISIDSTGNMSIETLMNVPVENFSQVSNQFKNQDYSMNLEGITIDNAGNIFIVSDNTSGKADCAAIARERTILLELKKK